MIALCTASWVHGRFAAGQAEVLGTASLASAPGLPAVHLDTPSVVLSSAGQDFGSLRIRAHYSAEVQAACPGGLQVSTSLDAFGSTLNLVQQHDAPDVSEALLHYLADSAGVRVRVTFMMNAGVYETSTPKACLEICPGYSTAGQQAWGASSFVVLPLDATESLVEAWPSFCQARGRTHVEEFWSDEVQRPFNISVSVPPSLLENRLPRPEGRMPSILIRLDKQFFWTYLPDGGDRFLSGLSMAGAARELVFIDVDFTLHGDPLWRHPLLVPTTLKDCPADSDNSAALHAWPSLRSTWDDYLPTYEDLNSTYGFGQADALLSFLYDEMLPRVVERHFPTAHGGRAVRLRDLDVGLWGISDAGYAAWYGVWTRPGDFDAAFMQTPLVLWNCAELLDVVERTGADWMGRARSGEFGATPPRFYMDHGEQEDPNAYTVPIEALYGLLRQLGMLDGQDLFLNRGQGDGHFSNAFYQRSLKGLLALYGSAESNLAYVSPQPSPLWRGDVKT